MAHVLKYSEWQDPLGRWLCNDVTDFKGESHKWYTPARMLEISLIDFILLLRDVYGATIDKYNPDADVLIYHWEKNQYAKCHSFVLYVNRIARKKQFKV